MTYLKPGLVSVSPLATDLGLDEFRVSDEDSRCCMRPSCSGSLAHLEWILGVVSSRCQHDAPGNTRMMPVAIITPTA